MRIPTSALFLGFLTAPLFSQAALQTAQAPAPVQLDQSWSYSSYGRFIGDAGVLTAKTPLGLELYVGGFVGTLGSDNNYWHALRYDQQKGDFEPLFASEIFASYISRLLVGNLHPNPGKEIAVVLEDGMVIVYGQMNKEEIHRYATGISDVTNAFAADLDQDGLDEILLASAGGAHAFAPSTALFASYPQLVGMSLVAGQMDADPSMEIADSLGVVVDVATAQVQCTFATEMGDLLAISDIDSDGMLEVIGQGYSSSPKAFDIDSCSVKWTLNIINKEHFELPPFSGHLVYAVLPSGYMASKAAGALPRKPAVPKASAVRIVSRFGGEIPKVMPAQGPPAKVKLPEFGDQAIPTEPPGVAPDTETVTGPGQAPVNDKMKTPRAAVPPWLWLVGCITIGPARFWAHYQEGTKKISTKFRHCAGLSGLFAQEMPLELLEFLA